MQCDYCRGATDHDTIAHLTPQAAMKAAEKARMRGDSTRELQWLEVSKKLSNEAKRKARAAEFGR